MNPNTVIAMEPMRNPLRGNGLFARSDDEQEFLQEEWAFIGSRLRSLGIWGTLAFMLAAVTDWIALGPTPDFFGIFVLRFFVLGLGLNLVRISSAAQAPEPASLAQALLVFEAAIVTIFLLVVAAYGGTVEYHAITALLLVIALYAYAPALSSVSLWLGPAFTLLFLLEAVFVLHAQPKVTSIMAVLLTFANFVGWQIAVQFNRMQRLNWLDRRSLRHEAADRLAAELRALDGEDSLSRVFDATPVPMVLARQHDGRVLHYNEAAERLLDTAGKTRGGLVPFSSDFFSDPEQFAQQRRILLRDGRVGPLDVRLKTTEDKPVDVMLSSALLQFHGEPAIITSLVEITARKTYERELQRLAHTDPLTGLRNRRGFFAEASAQLQAARASGGALAVLLIDADHFKRINDTHGHGVGDQALRQMGLAIQAALCETAVLTRVGGEEFACLIPGASLQRAGDIAERCRARVVAQELRCGEVTLQVSLSIGVSLVLEYEQRIDEALSRADRAMYAAKQAGRNRVSLAA
ncbi:putative diguanylate cyclase YcdT [mine drainage metagenome]|uniref:Putative diguanylate cyclase YcdT n=1 Tax=mine drainage metagenome TaxID=410659 RepID=A0A1J5RBH7_9ZZZZ